MRAPHGAQRLFGNAIALISNFTNLGVGKRHQPSMKVILSF